MNPNLNPENANFAAVRGPERLYVWMHPDGSCTFGVIAANGVTNFQRGTVQAAVAFVNNSVAQGWTAQRFDQRWEAAHSERTATGSRRKQALITLADREQHPSRTLSINANGDQFLVVDLEGADPDVQLLDLKAALEFIFSEVKAGWIVTRVTPEFVAAITAKLSLSDVVPASE